MQFFIKSLSPVVHAVCLQNWRRTAPCAAGLQHLLLPAATLCHSSCRDCHRALQMLLLVIQYALAGLGPVSAEEAEFLEDVSWLRLVELADVRVATTQGLAKAKHHHASARNVTRANDLPELQLLVAVPAAVAAHCELKVLEVRSA